MTSQLTSEVVLQFSTGMALGILAWVLPYRWNPFRLKRFVGGFLSESANRKVPRIFGTFIMTLSIVLLIAKLMK